MIKIEDLSALPPRIPASVVCRLAGYSKGTLAKKISIGQMPQPIDKIRKRLFLTSAVLQSLGIEGNVEPANKGWECDFDGPETT